MQRIVLQEERMKKYLIFGKTNAAETKNLLSWILVPWKFFESLRSLMFHGQWKWHRIRNCWWLCVSFISLRSLKIAWFRSDAAFSSSCLRFFSSALFVSPEWSFCFLLVPASLCFLAIAVLLFILSLLFSFLPRRFFLSFPCFPSFSPRCCSLFSFSFSLLLLAKSLCWAFFFVYWTITSSSLSRGMSVGFVYCCFVSLYCGSCSLSICLFASSSLLSCWVLLSFPRHHFGWLWHPHHALHAFRNGSFGYSHYVWFLLMRRTLPRASRLAWMDSCLGYCSWTWVAGQGHGFLSCWWLW